MKRQSIMEKRRSVALAWVLLVVVIAAIATLRRTAVAAAKDGSQAAGRRSLAPGEERTVELARSWLDGLKAMDAEAVVSDSALPLVFATTERRKKCDRSVSDKDGVVGLLACVSKREKMFVDELRAAGRLKLREIDQAKVPAALGKMVQGAGTHLVYTFVNGDGISFDIVLAISATKDSAAPGVKAVYVDAEIEGEG